MKKFQVILIDCVEQNCSIMKTFKNYNDGCEYINEYITSSIKPNSYVKCFFDGNGSISVYQYYIVYPKRLIKKIQLLEYEDIDN